MYIARGRFEELVKGITSEVMDAIPADMRRKAAHIIFKAADRPTRTQCELYNDGYDDLLGLFEGVPLPERHIDDMHYLPDQITLFRFPLAEMCSAEDELSEEIRITVIHELGHFFGFGEDALEKLGFA